MGKMRNVIVMSALAVTCVFASKSNISAKSKIVKPLQPNKIYQYNLDQKGAKEKIKVVKEDIDDISDSITLYINDKAVASNVENGEVCIIDTNKKDKQMEVLIQKNAYYYERSAMTYYRYKNGKLKKVQTLGSVAKKKFKNLSGIHGVTYDDYDFAIDGKGNLKYVACLRLSNGLDFVHINDTMQMKNGKFVASSKKSFTINYTGIDKYPNRAKGTNKVYQKPGSSKVIYKLKDKERFYKTGIYLKNRNTLYVKVKIKKTNKTGYINNKNFKAYYDDTMHA